MLFLASDGSQRSVRHDVDGRGAKVSHFCGNEARRASSRSASALSNGVPLYAHVAGAGGESNKARGSSGRSCACITLQALASAR